MDGATFKITPPIAWPPNIHKRLNTFNMNLFFCSKKYFTFMSFLCFCFWAWQCRPSITEEQAEKMVVNNAVYNYNNKKYNFLQLTDFIKETGINNFRDLMFLDNDRIVCSVFADSFYVENLKNDIPTIMKIVPDFRSITLLPNNQAKIMYADTFLVLSKWIWEFEGGVNDIGYDFILKCLKLDHKQILTFKSLIKDINCESISVEKNQKIELIFDGCHHYNVRYAISNTIGYETFRYLKIDTNVFCGVFKELRFRGKACWEKMYMPN